MSQPVNPHRLPEPVPFPINDFCADFSSIENHVFTFEEGLWNIRSRYKKACEEDEELVWSNVDGEYVTHILIVSLSSCSFL